MLRIEVFGDQSQKIIVSVNRGFFMASVNGECWQTLAMQTNAKLKACVLYLFLFFHQMIALLKTMKNVFYFI